MKKHEATTAPEDKRNSRRQRPRRSSTREFRVAFTAMPSAETKMDVAPLIEQFAKNLQGIANDPTDPTRFLRLL